jgi:hypothetical protein
MAVVEVGITVQVENVPVYSLSSMATHSPARLGLFVVRGPSMLRMAVALILATPQSINAALSPIAH